MLENAGWTPPQLPMLVAEPPVGDDWIHEIKHDGYRIQLVTDRDGVRVFTRNGHDWTTKFRCIAQDAALLPGLSAVIDGEAIVQDTQGRSDFFALRRALDHEPHRVVMFAFDLLALNGEDLRDRPLAERRARLRELLGDNVPGNAIQFSDDVADGRALFAAADRLGLEGIVSKRASSRYRSGYAKTWLKTKCMAEDAFILIGAERAAGRPAHALLAREVDGALEYAGSAFVTFAGDERRRFWDEVERLRCERPEVRMPRRCIADWCRPELQVRARYLKGSDKLRHASLSAVG